MKTKCLVIMMLLLGLIVSVQAEELVNGDFENPATPLGSWDTNTPIPGWEFGGDYIPTGGWQAGLCANDAGRVRDNGGARIWGLATTLYQEFDVTPGMTYLFSLYCHNQEDFDTADGVLYLEATFYSGTAIVSSEVVGIFDTAVDGPHPSGEWTQIGDNVVAPATATKGRISIYLRDRTAGGIDFDDASVRSAGASFPTPEDGADVGLGLTELSWTNPVPVFPETDEIECAVYLVTDPNFYDGPIVSGLKADSVTLADYSVTLEDDTTYYWRVDCTDPNNGGAIFYPGDVWTFHVGDVLPQVTAGDDINGWINQEDGDGDMSMATFTITGTYTDDDKSPIVRAEWVGDNIISQSEPTPGTVEAIINVTAATTFTLTLEVEDSAGIGSDSLDITVHEDCIAAAIADGETTEMAAAADINRDCLVDLYDLQILASSWMACLSPKGNCMIVVE